MRPELANNEFYHVYNHGVEDRVIFDDNIDFERFVESMDVFNTVEPIGSLYLARQQAHRDKRTHSRKARRSKKLVNIISYCLNPNHYHMVLEQIHDDGISEFMKRLNGGYSWYFNFRRKRRGTLFEGKFKAKHIKSNDYLLYVSVYVNLNNKVHRLSGRTAQYRSSWHEFTELATTKGVSRICSTDVILDQFDDPSDYVHYAEETLRDILANRKDMKELKELLLEKW